MTLDTSVSRKLVFIPKGLWEYLGNGMEAIEAEGREIKWGDSPHPHPHPLQQLKGENLRPDSDAVPSPLFVGRAEDGYQGQAERGE